MLKNLVLILISTFFCSMWTGAFKKKVDTREDLLMLKKEQEKILMKEGVFFGDLIGRGGRTKIMSSYI